MFDKAHGGGEVVHEPAESAVVEVDDAQVRVVHQQIGKVQVRMHEAEAIRAPIHGAREALTDEASMRRFPMIVASPPGDIKTDRRRPRQGPQ